MAFHRRSIVVGLFVTVSCCFGALAPSPLSLVLPVFAGGATLGLTHSPQNRDDKKDKSDDKKKEPRYIDKKPKDNDRRDDKGENEERRPSDR
ncbi:MAG: hypothetical protein ACUVR8_00680 [Acidobacteriota bacterium]